MEQKTQLSQKKLSGWKKNLGIVGILFFSGIIFAVVKFPLFIKQQAQLALEQGLKPIGFKRIEVGSAKISRGKLCLRDIRLHPVSGNPPLLVEQIYIELSLWMRVQSIDIAGVTLDLSNANNLLSTLVKWYGQAPRQSALSFPPDFNFPALILRNATVVMPVNMGNVKVPIQGMTKKENTHHYNVALKWGESEAKSFAKSFKGTINIDFDQKQIMLNAAIKNVNINTPSLEICLPDFCVSGKLARNNYDRGELQASTYVEHLRIDSYGFLKTPLKVNLVTKGTLKELFIDKLSVSDNDKKIIHTLFKGTVNLSDCKALLSSNIHIEDISKLCNLKPLLFSLIGQQPSIKGQLAMKGDLIWRDNHVYSDNMVMNITHGQIAHTGFFIEGITSQIQLKSFWPLSAFDRQTIKAFRMTGAGTEFTNILFNFTLDDKAPLRIETFTADAFKGKLKAHNFTRLTNDPLVHRFDLNLEHIELAEILKLIDTKTLYGEGKLTGNASLVYDPGKGLEVLDANLHSTTESGIIRYVPAHLQTPLPKAEDDFGENNMAFQVLGNLHYTLLNINLNRDQQNPDELRGTVKLLGYNPDILNGYPFEFNIATTGALKDLIVNTLRQMNPSQNLNDYHRRYLGQKRNGK